MLTVIKNKLFNLFQDKDKKELIFGSSVSFGLNMGSVLLGFIFLYMVSRFYGVDGTGLFSIGQSFVIIISAISLMGLNMASIRYIGQYRSEKNKIISLYKNSFITILLVSLLFSTLLFLLSDYLAQQIFKDIRLALILKISALIIPFCAIKDYHSDFLKGFKKIAAGEFVKKFLFISLASAFIFLTYNFGYNIIYIPILAYGLSILVVALLSFFILWKKYLFYSRNYSHDKQIETISYKEILATSLPMVVTVIALVIMGNIDKLMIGYFIDTTATGIYSVAFSCAITLNFVIKSVNSILTPNISQKFWDKDMERLQKNITFGTKIIFFATLPIFLILIIFGKQILSIFGTDFIAGYHVLLILCVGQIINSISGSTGFFLNMTGNQKIFQKIILCTLFLNIILNIILIPLLGILGAAIATAISIFTWNIISIIYIKNKYDIITYYLGINRK